MGTVIISLKILPESIDIDLKALQAEIGKNIELKDVKEEPVAFGLKALTGKVFVDDSEGGSDEVEEKIKKVPGVGQIQIIAMDRI